MTTDPPTDPAPEKPTFDAIDLSAPLRRAVDELGFRHPTPVQLAVFESAARGRDLVVQARTGTGKTAAFGLPLVDALVEPERKSVQALVLSPTRELALQIHRELDGLAKYLGVTCTAVYGGAPMQPQVDALTRGAHVVVGTPGRVLDHLERGTLDPSDVSVLVLDESDEMLSMGFLPQITRVIDQLPRGHQTLLFSATVPPDVRRIADSRLTDPEYITLSGDHIGALSIQHFAYRSRGNKADELVQIIEAENPESAIVFCNTRDQTKRIAEALQVRGYSADWLNADLSQSDRERVMKNTRDGNLRFLVATDVAARGIDISHLTHVLNADFPDSTENYVHRTGRTGRAGRTGTAISLVGPKDIGNLYMLRLTYKIFPVERDLPTERELASRKEADVLSHLGEKLAERRPSAFDLAVARRLLGSEDAELLVAGLLRAHLGDEEASTDAAARERRAKKNGSELAQAESRGERSGKHDKSGKRDKDRKSKDHKDKHDKKRKKHDDQGASSASALSEGDDSEVAAAEGRDLIAAATHDGTAANDAAAHDSIDASTLLGGSILALLDGDDAPAPKRASGTRPRPLAAVASAIVSDRGASKPTDDRAAPSRTAPNHSATSDDEDRVRVFVSVGRRDGAYREDVEEALSDRGIEPGDVTFVKVRDTHTFVGVSPEFVERVIAALDGATIAGVTAKAERARPVGDRGHKSRREERHGTGDAHH